MKLRSTFRYQARGQRRQAFYHPELLRLEDRVTPGFLAPRAFDTGAGPESVAVGDFNGDGILDLAVANGFSDNVSVLLGTGDGSFQAARSFAAGNSPHSVVVGDFNSDGLLDLAVANYGTPPTNGSVSVLLGTGDGSFQTAVDYAAGSEPNSVAVGDFNGDGIPDLAVATDVNVNGDTVSVLLGTGDGSFQTAHDFAAGSAPSSVVVGDFNRDGIDDLVTGNQGSDNVSILLANGDGSFQPALNFREGEFGTGAVAVGDFNGDGIPDLASVSDGVSVRLNDGNWPGSPDGAPHTGSGPGFGRQPRRHWPGAERALVSLGVAQTVRATPESALPTPAAGIATRASVSPEFAVGRLDQLFAGTVREQPRVTLWRLAARARVWRDAWFTLDSDGWSVLNGGG